MAAVSLLHNVLAKKRLLGWQGAVRYAVNWLALRAMEAEGRSFDARRGVDTAGVVEKTDSVYSAVSVATLGNYYRAVSPAVLRKILRAVSHRAPALAFVDMGSGKGRAVLIATDHPFKRIVGVEIAPELHAIATRNLGSHRPGLNPDVPIELVCGDATRYDARDEPSLYFFFNPFPSDIMASVMKRIEATTGAHTESWLAVVRPTPAVLSVMTASGRYRIVRRHRSVFAEQGGYVLLRAGDSSARGGANAAEWLLSTGSQPGRQDP